MLVCSLKSVTIVNAWDLFSSVSVIVCQNWQSIVASQFVSARVTPMCFDVWTTCARANVSLTRFEIDVV